MTADRGDRGRIIGFGLLVVMFAPANALVLIGLPLAMLLIAYGPRNFRSAFVVAAAATFVLLGDRSGLWWFERGWSLILAGMFVWIVGLRPAWTFSAQALGALGLAVTAVVPVFLLRPGAWLNIDALMTARLSQAAQSVEGLLGSLAGDAAGAMMQRVVAIQVALFPALLGFGSIGALGVAVSVRRWIMGGVGRTFDQLRSFRFNDHLIWLWLLGLGLILAPVGEFADRVGGNAVLFMGALYVVRGFAVTLSLIGGIPVLAGVIGGIVAVVISPILMLLAGLMLIVGLSDTWLNMRSRIRKQRGEG